MSELLNKLKEPFPKNAMSTDSSRGFDLTSIKPQFIVERLNDVFGLFGWEFTPEYEVSERSVLCHGTLKVTKIESGNKTPRIEGVNYNDTRTVKQTGGSIIRKSLPDAYKSASTDSLSKCASWLCIGNDVFKGDVDPRTFEIKASPVGGDVKKLVAEIGGIVVKFDDHKISMFMEEYSLNSSKELYKMTTPKLEEILKRLNK